MTFPRFFIFALLFGALLVGCGGDSPSATPAATEAPGSDEGVVAPRPQNRTGIGDVDRAFVRYEATRAELIELFKRQSWFEDGLSRDESLFVERSLAFVSRYGRARTEMLSDASVRDKLYKYEKVALKSGELELLLIYEPGQDGTREMAFMVAAIPALESIVGVEFPERMLTVINGQFGINDFNEGQFIRMDRCCVLNSFILAHELAHTYWSMGPSWFNEGMADVYSRLAVDALSEKPPAGWRLSAASLDDFYRSRKAAASSSRFPDLPLPRRFMSDGLYEAADVFILDIRRLLGPEIFGAAVRDIYLASDFGRYNLREKRIEDVFLEHAKPADREELMAMFNRSIWGDNGERYQKLKELEGS